MGGADPAAPMRGGADPATGTNSTSAKGKLPRTLVQHAMYNVPDVPEHKGNEEVPGCRPTPGGEGLQFAQSLCCTPRQPSSCPGAVLTSLSQPIKEHSLARNSLFEGYEATRTCSTNTHTHIDLWKHAIKVMGWGPGWSAKRSNGWRLQAQGQLAHPLWQTFK